MLKIGIVGCGGRMGRMLLAETLETAGATLAGGIDRSPAIIGQDLGMLAGRPAIGIIAGEDQAALVGASDVLIDFTAAAASAALAPVAAAAGRPLVLGTTGFDAAQNAVIAEAARLVPVVRAANFSIGLNLLIGLVREAARTLGPEYDIEISEVHHRGKIDAPSGTALALGQAAAEGRGATLDDLRIRARDGVTGPRPAGGIGFASARGGDIVGDHLVLFAADGERIELGHRATDRRLFAAGALRAALWVAGRAAGLYGMADVLALDTPKV